MPRKKRSAKLDAQLNVRCTRLMYERIEQLAQQLDIDPSDVVRLILNEHLSEHEDRAARAARHDVARGSSPPDPTA